MRLSLDDLVARARAAEAAGFTGIALMDHLAPPQALDQPMYEAMLTAAVLAAGTERLRVGHLVLCDAFRHPAVLAREAVTLDHASGGRFDLGIGWGSVTDEFVTYGIGSTEARHRVTRLGETLEIVRALWTGAPLDFTGEHFTLEGAAQQPVPLGRIPIVIGGAGKRTMELVAAHADWWNVPVHRLDRLDEMRPLAGAARVSVQQMVTFVGDESARDRTEELAVRRFGHMGSARVTGGPDELRAHFASLAASGVERVYAWFSDFAPADTLAAFGAGVIAR